MKNPICFALDVSSFTEATSYMSLLENHVGAFKVGLELFTSCGPSILRKAQKPVVLDLKLHDIPETVVRSIKAAGDLGVKYMTLHIQQRETMLRAAEMADKYGITLLGVTVLTSITINDFDDLRYDRPHYFYKVGDRVHQLARYAISTCGLKGLVCSPEDVAHLRMNCNDKEQPFLLVPGIRPAGSDLGDQKRTGTPKQALKDGANLIVVGRPIRDSRDPIAAAESILAECME